MLELERVLHAIQLILDGRYGDHEFTPWPGPTHLDELPPAAKEATSRKVEEANEASRERAAIYSTLSSSAMLLGVTQRLMSAPVYHSPNDGEARLRLLVDEIDTGARAAYRASLVLLDVDPCLDLVHRRRKPAAASEGT